MKSEYDQIFRQVNDIDEVENFAIVIPIKINYHIPDRKANLLTRLTEVLLPSLEKYASVGFSRIVIITKDDEYEIVTRTLGLLRPTSIRLEVIPESVIFPAASDMKISGWFLQQMLKLQVSFFLSEKYYLLLDTDCFLRATVSTSDLATPDGLVTNLRPFRWRDGLPEVNKWYYSTCDTFNLNLATVAKVFDPQIVFGVTPNIMVTQYVRDCILYFSALTDNHDAHGLFVFLSENTKNEKFQCAAWTEYTLYWLYLVLSGRLNDYRTNIDIKLARHEIWTAEQFYKARGQGVNYIFEKNDRSFFVSLVQSAIPEITDDEVLGLMKPFLQMEK